MLDSTGSPLVFTLQIRLLGRIGESHADEGMRECVGVHFHACPAQVQVQPVRGVSRLKHGELAFLEALWPTQLLLEISALFGPMWQSFASLSKHWGESNTKRFCISCLLLLSEKQELQLT